jgi:hypothetical protein
LVPPVSLTAEYGLGGFFVFEKDSRKRRKNHKKDFFAYFFFVPFAAI